MLKNEGRVCHSAETSGFSCWLNCEGGNPREGAAGEITWGGQCGQLLRLLNVSFEPWNFSYAWSGFNKSLCRIIGNWLRKWVWDIKRGKKEFWGRVLVETWAFSVTYFWTKVLCSDCSTTIFCSDSLKCWDLLSREIVLLPEKKVVFLKFISLSKGAFCGSPCPCHMELKILTGWRNAVSIFSCSVLR